MPRNITKTKINCAICGKEHMAVPSEIRKGKGRFCSLSCAAKNIPVRDMTGEKNPNWRGGISDNSGSKKRYREKFPEKYIAHKLMTNAIRSGKLVRGLCQVCGNEKVDGHHVDYSKPLDIVWLCRKHHIEAHGGRF